MTKKLLYLNDRQATWLELFFDLIFVVALGKVILHLHRGNVQEKLSAGGLVTGNRLKSDEGLVGGVWGPPSQPPS